MQILLIRIIFGNDLEYGINFKRRGFSGGLPEKKGLTNSPAPDN